MIQTSKRREKLQLYEIIRQKEHPNMFLRWHSMLVVFSGKRSSCWRLPRLLLVTLYLTALLRIPQWADAFSSSDSSGRSGPTSSAQLSNHITESDNCRVFFAPAEESKAVLLQHLEQYGTVVDISIHKMTRTTKQQTQKNTGKKANIPYAFVTFQDSEAAQAAIADNKNNEWTIQPAQPRGKTRRKSNARRDRFNQTWTHAHALASNSNTNLILQVHRSHVDRIQELLWSAAASQQADVQRMTVLKEFPPSSTTATICLLCVQTTKEKDSVSLLEWMRQQPFDIRGLNKAYQVQQMVRQCDVAVHPDKKDDSYGNLLHHVVALLSNHQAPPIENESTAPSSSSIRIPAASRVRLHVFPPKLLSQILPSTKTSCACDDDKPLPNQIELDPKDYSYEISIVQMDSSDGVDGKGPMYMVGCNPVVADPSTTRITKEEFDSETASSTHSVSSGQAISAGTGTTKRNNAATTTHINRAYVKLQEAWSRYNASSLPDHPKGALDCGAAPGGWTQFLLDQYGHTSSGKSSEFRVWSVDPGDLDPSVAANGACEHVRTTIQLALPLLASKNAIVDIWVSDMCLHDMSAQVDWLLQARRRHAIWSAQQLPTFFVLTLKCTVGHSAKSFEAQVAPQVERLKTQNAGYSSTVQVLHLLANRSGERTVMGYLA